jgi:hypothetical protein
MGTNRLTKSKPQHNWWPQSFSGHAHALQEWSCQPQIIFYNQDNRSLGWILLLSSPDSLIISLTICRSGRRKIRNWLWGNEGANQFR